MNLEIISSALDVGLLILGSWIAILVIRMNKRGGLAVSFGFLILGLAHLSETVLFQVFNFSLEAGEVIHRLFVFIGLAFVLAGFLRLVPKKI